MSFWLRVDSNRPGHFKWAVLSDAAYRFADKVLCWGARNETAFVPAPAMAELAGTRGRAQRLCAELERCGESQGKQGILEPAEGGWRIHDAEQYWPPGARSVDPKPTGTDPTLSAKRAEAGRRGALAKLANAPGKPGKRSGKNLANGQQLASPPLCTPPSQNGSGSDSLQPLDPRDLTGFPAHEAGKSSGGGGTEEPDGEPESAEPSRAGAPVHAAPAPAPARETDELEPVQIRAQRCLGNPHDASFLAPETWPEVVAVVEAFKRAAAQPNARSGSFARDPGIRAVVGLLADGYTAPELVHAVERAAASTWWKGGKRGLSTFSPEVVRRALAEDPAPPAPRYESADERARCRNHLLTKAQAGEYGLAAKFWEKFGEGEERGELADRLERREEISEAVLPERLVQPFRHALAKRKVARGTAESSPVPLADALARAAGGRS